MYLEYNYNINRQKYYILTLLYTCLNILLFCNHDDDTGLKLITLNVYSFMSMYYLILVILPFNIQIIYNKSYQIILYVISTIYITLTFSYSYTLGLTYNNIVDIFYTQHWVYVLFIHFIFTTYLAYFAFIIFIMFDLNSPNEKYKIMI